MAINKNVMLTDGGGGGGKKAPAKVSTKATSPAKKPSAGVAKAAPKAPAKAAASKLNNSGSGGGTKPKTTTTTAAAAPAAVVNKDTLIQWHDVMFYANARRVVGFTGLFVSSSVETEDKEDSGTKYVTKKNSKGYEAGLTAYFDRRLGIDDVQAEAMKLVDYGANGQTGYLYAQGKKLVSSSLMMTSAKASKIIMTPAGMWISAEVQITLKTCGKLDGGADNTGGGGYKYSVRVYYSGSSGAVQSVVGYSNKSKDDARKKAWAKVPKTALWASETQKQATNQSPKLTDAALEAARRRVATSAKQTEAAKTESEKIGITNRNNAVQNKMKNILKKDARVR